MPEIAYQTIAILGGFVLLVWGADRFVLGAAALARNFGVSPLLIGLTIVGFGTSAPEMLVSAVAASHDSASLCVGNALGSNITNIALVLGAAALVSPMDVHSKVVKRELPVLILVSLFAYALLYDGDLGRTDGVALLLGLVGMMAWVVREGIVEGGSDDGDSIGDEMEDEIPTDMATRTALLWIVVGLAVLLGSSEALVWGATGVARFLGVGELVIGLTVVAFGTSLPELAATLAAARRNEHDIAIGNIVGSNLFNTLGVLALPGLIAPGPVSASVLRRDFPFVLALGLLLLVLARGLRPPFRLGRPQGALLVLIFAGYIAVVVMQGDIPPVS